MRKSKIVFGIIAVVVAAICIAAIVLSNKGSRNHPATPPGNVGPSHSQYSPDETDPAYTDPSQSGAMETREYSLGGGTSVRKLVKDYDGPLDRTTMFAPSHPEYIDLDEQGFPRCCNTGCVFRNNKEITVTLAYKPTVSEEVEEAKITFGHITATANRFLYLDPKATFRGESVPWNFHFFAVTNGTVVTIPYERNEHSTRTFSRTLDAYDYAGYYNAHYPGTVWYVQNDKAKTATIDAIAYTELGDFVGIFRIYIKRNEDGTYEMSSVYNLDSNQIRYMDLEADIDPSIHYSPSWMGPDELAYIEELAELTLSSQDAVHALLNSGNPIDIDPDRMIVDFRSSEDTRDYFYFDAIIPYDSSDPDRRYEYKSVTTPILAVTLRGLPAPTKNCTLYYLAIATPETNEKHGTYLYIGRDYWDFMRYEDLEGQYYPGSDLERPKGEQNYGG